MNSFQQTFVKNILEAKQEYQKAKLDLHNFDLEKKQDFHLAEQSLFKACRYKLLANVEEAKHKFYCMSRALRDNVCLELQVDAKVESILKSGGITSSIE